MIKSLNIIESMELNQGGPPEVIRNLKKSLNKNENIISVLPLDKLTFIQCLKFLFLRKARSRLYRFASKFDIVHSHSIWSFKVALFTYLISKIGIKIIFSSHGYLEEWSMKHSLLKKKLFIFFILKKLISRSFIFFSNEGEFKDSKKNLKIFSAFVIPNGMDTSLYNYKEEIFNHKKKIIFFGRIHKKKGIEILLDAIRELPKEYFLKYSFEITGPGETNYINKIIKIMKSYHIDEYVKMLPPKIGIEKIKYLQNSDVFVLPSFEEGDSIALKEAMSARNAVIISEQCRVNTVKDENAGIVIKTNKDSLKNALLQLDKFDLKAMGVNSKNIIEKYYDNDFCSKRVLKIYEDIHTGSYSSDDWVKNYE